MKKSYVLLFALLICSTFTISLFGMKKLFKNIKRPFWTNKKLFCEAIVKKDYIKAFSFLKKDKKFVVTKKLLISIAKQGKDRFPLRMIKIGRFAVWFDYCLFHGCDKKLFSLMVERMDKKTILDPWTMKAIICSDKVNFLEIFLDKYRKLGGDVNQRYKLPCSEWNWCDFLVAASKNRNQFLKYILPDMIKTFFKKDFFVSPRFTRPNIFLSNIGKRNAFEEYFFYNKHLRSLLADRLLQESEKSGFKAKLLVAILDEDLKSVKQWARKVDCSYLGNRFGSKSLFSPLELAIETKNEKIVSYLLLRYAFDAKKGDKNLAYYFHLVINNGLVESASCLLGCQARIDLGVLSAVAKKPEIFGCCFVKKMLDKYKESGGVLDDVTRYYLFKFALGKSNNKKLLQKLDETDSLKKTVVSFLRQDIHFFDVIDRRFNINKYSQALDVLKELNYHKKGKLPIASVVLSVLNYEALKHLMNKGANIEYALKCLRKKIALNLSGEEPKKKKNDTKIMLSEKFLSKSELSTFYYAAPREWKRQSQKMDDIKAGLVLRMINNYLARRKACGFARDGSVSNERTTAFKKSNKELKRWHDLKVVLER